MTALTWPSNSTGSTMTLRGSRPEQPERDRHDLVGHVGDQHAPRVGGALADQPFAHPQPLRDGRRLRRRHRPRAAAGRPSAFGQVDDALLRVDQRRQLGQQHAADGRQIALALQHAGEPGEVGLQPVLLGVAVGREPQVVDHRVDVVFELGDLAARVDLDRPRQVALGHRGRDLGDGAHLRRQVGGQQVDVAGQVLPGAGRAGHVRLAAEAALDADLARHASSPDRRRSRACRSCC